MEVLEAKIIMQNTWWHIMGLSGIVAGLIAILVACIIETRTGVIISTAVLVIGAVMTFALPAQTPTDKWATTVELTDDVYYKQFVQEGYTFKRIYDGREIYIIEGPEVEEGKG